MSSLVFFSHTLLLLIGNAFLQLRWDGDGGVGAAAAKLPAPPAEPHGRGRRSKVADSGAYAARRSCFTVAKPVDDDLYGIPPEMVFEKSSRVNRYSFHLLWF